MPKRIIWKSTTVERDKLAAWLSTYNFQPGKFHLLNWPWNNDLVQVVYVDKEIKNVE